MNIEEIKQKMFDKLKPSGWDRVFKSFIFSSDFDQILTTLYNLSKEDKRFTPPLKDLFRTFEECPYSELKVVIIGQDPYPALGVADGIAFSCSKSEKEQPSLRFMHDEIGKIYPNGYDRPLDLAKWTRQGVLMLNTALTTEVSKIGSHYDIWKSFTTYLLDWLNNYNPGLIYLYMGKKAEEWSDMTNENSHKFFVKHPASAAYNGSKWDSDGVFTKIQALVQELNGETITW
jgi:uracil-DNA glycosylase